MIAPSAYAYAAHHAACTTDDCAQLSELGTRMREEADRVNAVNLAASEYRALRFIAEELECWCADFDTARCGSWLWLDVEAAALAYDMALAEWIVGRRPRIASREIPLS